MRMSSETDYPGRRSNVKRIGREFDSPRIHSIEVLFMASEMVRAAYDATEVNDPENQSQGQ